jgi:hypothetical protein
MSKGELPLRFFRVAVWPPEDGSMTLFLNALFGWREICLETPEVLFVQGRHPFFTVLYAVRPELASTRATQMFDANHSVFHSCVDLRGLG